MTLQKIKQIQDRQDRKAIKQQESMTEEEKNIQGMIGLVGTLLWIGISIYFIAKL